MTIEIDRHDQTTIAAALIHYGLACADPSRCVTALEKVYPEPKRPWQEIMDEAIAKKAAL